MTNYENIKTLGVEEMVTLLGEEFCDHCAIECDGNTDCEEGIKKWLEQEYMPDRITVHDLVEILMKAPNQEAELIVDDGIVSIDIRR